MIFPWAFIFYISGLGLAGSQNIRPVHMSVLIAAGIASALMLRRYRAASVILVLCFLPLGALLGKAARIDSAKEDIHSIYTQFASGAPLTIYGEIVTGGRKIYGKDAFLIKTEMLESRGETKYIKARLLVFNPDPEPVELRPGDWMKFDCVLGDPKQYLNSPQVVKLGAEAWCFAQRGSIESVPILNPIMKILTRFKYALLGNLALGLDDDEAILYQGVVFGYHATDLGKQIQSDFQRAGISHLIVASGAQVALIIFPFFTIYRRLRYQWIRALMFIFMALAMLLLLFIVGPSSSILRAVSIGFIVLIGYAIGRPTHSLNSLAFAGLIWLVINPLYLNDAGFLLSYSAAFGIIYMGPVLVAAVENRFPRGLRGADPLKRGFWKSYFWVKRNLIHLGIVTTASQWGVLPVLAMLFGRVSLNGIIANLLAVPAGSIVLILGALSSVAGFVHPSLSYLLNAFAKPLLVFLIWVASIFAKLDLLTRQGVRISLPVFIAYYLVSILVIEALRGGMDVLTYLSGIRKFLSTGNS